MIVRPGLPPPFVIGDCDDETEAQCKEHLHLCMNAASGVSAPGAAVFY